MYHLVVRILFPAVGLSLAGCATAPTEQSATAEKTITELVSVVIGVDHGCSLSRSGMVDCWGSTQWGATSVPPGTFERIDAGGAQTCAVRDDSEIVCWGMAFEGERWDSVSKVIADDVSPLAPAANGPFTDVAVSHTSTCGLRPDGTIDCWGDSDVVGNIPDGAFVAIEAGHTVFCGARADKTLECWGDVHSPVQTPLAGAFDMVSVGDEHACGTRPDGSTSCWGIGWDPEADEPGNDFDQAVPPEGAFESVASGASSSCGIKTDGETVCWGNGFDGFEVVASRFHTLDAAGETFCGITTEGTIDCLGAGRAAVLWHPDFEVGGLAVTDDRVCTLDPGGRPLCREAERPQERAELGDESLRNFPAESLASLALGDRFLIATSIDGELIGRGGAAYGLALTPDVVVESVSTSADHACAITKGGELRCWGNDDYGKATPPDGQHRSVATGSRHSCALDIEGKVECWGRNADGESNPPSGSFVSVAVGVGFSCGLEESGQASCWGIDRLSAPSGGPFVQLVAGDEFVCGLTDQGAVRCTGYRLVPHLGDGPFDQLETGRANVCGVSANGPPICASTDRRVYVVDSRQKVEDIQLGWGTTCLNVNGTLQCSGRVGAEFGADENAAGKDIIYKVNGMTLCTLIEGRAACLNLQTRDPLDVPEGPFDEIMLGDGVFCGRSGQQLACKPVGPAFDRVMEQRCRQYQSRPKDGVPVYCSEEEQLKVSMPETLDANVTSVSIGGRDLGCALSADSDATCWADGFEAVPDEKLKQIDAGTSFACGITQTDEVKCWGTDIGMVPEMTAIDVDVAKATACAVTADGLQVACWGDPTPARWLPELHARARRRGNYRIETVEVADFQICARLSDESVVCGGDQ